MSRDRNKKGGDRALPDEHHRSVCNCAAPAPVPPPAGCATCDLPAATCPFAICLEAKLSADDLAGSSGYLIKLNDAFSNNILSIQHDALNAKWVFQGWQNAGSVMISDVTTPDVWHSFYLASFVQDTNLWITAKVDATTVTSEVVDGPFDPGSATATVVNVGSFDAGGNRSLRCVRLRSSGQGDYNFPDESFDSVVGSIAIVSGEIQINSGSPAYGVKALNWDIVCGGT